MERERRVPPAIDDPNAIYDEQYYRAGLGPYAYQRDERWLGFFGSIADNLVRTFGPKTALDVGCAMGMLVESLWDRGVIAQGIDVSAYALSCVRPDMRAHCRYGSIAEAVEGRFDVVTCIEVLEHLPPDATAAAVANLCRLSATIVFSSSPVDFDEPTHINVRPTLEWVRLFARNGFRADLVVDATFIAPHAVVFRRAERYDDAEIEAFVARQAALRITLSERDEELAELRPAREGALTRAGEFEAQPAQAERDAVRRRLETMRTASKREEGLRAVLVAAETERDASLERLSCSAHAHVRVRAELSALRRELAGLEESLRAECDRTARESERAAHLADELERLQNARLLDGMRRTDDAAELRRLRAIEERYARLAEAYASRSG